MLGFSQKQILHHFKGTFLALREACLYNGDDINTDIKIAIDIEAK